LGVGGSPKKRALGQGLKEGLLVGRGFRGADARARARGSKGPLSGTTMRVRDWAREILWSPSWTPKMTKAVPSTFFPYKNLREAKGDSRFSTPGR
jgi:hypothetical protein